MTNGLLLDLALSKEEQNLDVIAEACKRVRFRQSECQICADICPEQAISLELGPIINNNCTQCGLCISACPTETFQSKIDLEQYWLDQMQSLANTPPKHTHNKTLNIHCHRASAIDENSVKVHCVGNINENLLLASALMEFRAIMVHTGNCDECCLSTGVMLFNESLNRARSLTRLVNIDNPVLRLLKQTNEQCNEKKISRRGFFSRISKQVKEKAIPADYARTPPLLALLNYQDVEVEKEQHISQRRERLRRLINTLTEQKNEHGNSLTIEHCKKMSVEQEKCVACAICIHVCPTGALKKTVKNNHLYRYCSSALCTNCGLCQEACPQQIIHFKTNYTFSDLIEDKPELVACVEFNECQICGETIPSIEGKICTTCQKRQHSPMFLNI